MFAIEISTADILFDTDSCMTDIFVDIDSSTIETDFSTSAIFNVIDSCTSDILVTCLLTSPRRRPNSAAVCSCVCFCSCINSLMSVSYTHLDVYKRQDRM